MSELDLETLLQREPQEILTSVKASIVEHHHISSEFIWLELAENAYSNARNKNNSKESALLWARIAVTVYEYLYSSLPNTNNHRVRLECSEMRLKVSCIARFGPQKNNAILDPTSIMQWFFSSTKLTVDGVKHQLARLTELTTDELLALRQIKARLTVVEKLYKDHHIPSDAMLAIEDWLSIRNKIP